ncbi:MAG: hypothetical protein P8130_07950 [Deltaproteobacteria bacterium]|jgi:hypothetical protein
MSVLTHLLRNQHRTRNNEVLNSQAKAGAEKTEAAWCAFSFLLFLALGPFAAVPALFSILSLIPGDETLEPGTIDE